MQTDRIELCDAGDGWTEAFLLDASRSTRVANLGMWHASGGWVNDGPGGNERDVDDVDAWHAGVTGLAVNLTRTLR